MSKDIKLFALKQDYVDVKAIIKGKESYATS